ncbi:MAG: thiamine phosphate synthase [Parachlamydiales bacterium]|jgi:thiamine-phosphate pyrophosphorylase
MKKIIDHQLYLVAHQGTQTEDEFIKNILLAVEGGVNIVQLREKNLSSLELKALGKKLLQVLRPLKVPLIINDRVDIAYEIEADGVHLGQSDLSTIAARAILGNDALIGLSIENMEQAHTAQNFPVNYIAASPIFATQTKIDCAHPWGLVGLRKLCALSSHPVFAIGGINHINVDKVMDCGVSGIAVISAILNAPCPKETSQVLINKMEEYAAQRMG